MPFSPCLRHAFRIQFLVLKLMLLEHYLLCIQVCNQTCWQVLQRLGPTWGKPHKGDCQPMIPSLDLSRSIYTEGSTAPQNSKQCHQGSCCKGNWLHKPPNPILHLEELELKCPLPQWSHLHLRLKILMYVKNFKLNLHCYFAF